MDRIRIKALEQAVQEHLAEHGGRKWRLVQSRFPDVPHATFWRVVKVVRIASQKPRITLPADRPDWCFTQFFPLNCEPLKKLKEFQEQLQHADDLIAQSKGLSGAIKNWQMHARGVSLRQSILNRQVEIMERLVDTDRMAMFQIFLLDTAAAVDPSVRIVMLEQLKGLQTRDKEQLYEEIRKHREGV